MGDLANLHKPIYVDAVFNPMQCEEISDRGQTGRGDEWWIERDAPEIRRAWSATVSKSEHTQWIFSRIDAMFRFLAPRYGYDADQITSELLYARYETDDHFDWHSDLLNEGNIERKLSASILLSRTENLVGGDLEFHDCRAGEEFKLGSAVVFPSHLAHRVTPVECGRRDVLVAWFLGPRFK